VILLLLLTLQFQNNPTPAELAGMASEMYLDGHFAEASEIWQELLSRMPHRGRIAYNLAASQFMMDSLSIADSSLSLISEGIGEDTLACANALTNLAAAIQMNDYGGVENAVNILRGNISDGISPECERTGLEAGFNWLENHEPPEDQNEDQQDQNEDQQDQNEDQQDQNEDQQDQNEDQQDQNEDQPQPPPQIDEMTPEQAQAILDLVEENQQPEDSTGATKSGYSAGGPVW
jgi:hypothetical protein